MTYLDWGCDPLAAECQSCIDAICNACAEEFRKKPAQQDNLIGDEERDRDVYEPDCDRCDPAKKPDCVRCEIILEICRSCKENESCEFRITG